MPCWLRSRGGVTSRRRDLTRWLVELVKQVGDCVINRSKLSLSHLLDIYLATSGQGLVKQAGEVMMKYCGTISWKG